LKKADYKAVSNPGLAPTNFIDVFPPLQQKCKTCSFTRITLEEERFLLFFRRDS